MHVHKGNYIPDVSIHQNFEGEVNKLMHSPQLIWIGIALILIGSLILVVVAWMH